MPHVEDGEYLQRLSQGERLNQLFLRYLNNKRLINLADGSEIDGREYMFHSLTLEGEQRGQEELLVGRSRYLITSTGRHNSMMLQKHLRVNMFWGGRVQKRGMD